MPCATGVPAGIASTNVTSSAFRIARPVGVDSSTFGRVIASGTAATGMPSTMRAEAGGGTGWVPC